MSLSLALRAAAVYASALAVSRAVPAHHRRPVLIAASAIVAALPLLSLAPTWPADGGAAALITASFAALQEPAGSPGPATAEIPWWSAWSPSLGQALVWAWAAGAGIAAARLVADLRAVWRLRATARPDGHADRAEPDVATSDAVDVPVIVGILRPIVLLPVSSRGWTASHRRLALAHERAHATARDNLWLLVARVVACAHWFDPLAWRTVAALRDACEHTADDTVLAGGADPVDYADALVSIARGRAPALALAMARTSSLERRVRAVLGARRPAGAGPRWIGFAAVAVVAGLALAVGTASARPRAHAPPPSSSPSASPQASASSGLASAVDAEADRLLAAWSAEGVAIVVRDARTGATVAEADRGGLLDRPVSPGSVMKPFTVAAALEAGVAADHAFDDGDMASILARSSNPGALEIASAAGRPGIARVFARVGLPVDPSVTLERLALGDVLVSPAQVASAWAHLAGHGAIAPEVAAQVRELLVGVVDGGTGQRAQVPGLRIAGKTGTASLVRVDGAVDPDRMLASFVGLVPADDPAYVILVSVAGPQGDETWGGAVAAPAVPRIVAALPER